MMRKLLRTLVALVGITSMTQTILPAQDADAAVAARSVNEFGADLHKRLALKEPGKNLCVSPYSIQTALAMTHAGAEGSTRAEMGKALHYSGEQVPEAFGALKNSLDETAKRTVTLAANAKKFGGASEPIQWAVANRLYGGKGFEFRAPFLELVKSKFNAPLEQVNFKTDAAGATALINRWVADQTKEKIRDLIPPNALTPMTRLVLVNALYFKASWSDEFKKAETKDETFSVNGVDKVSVPTMRRTGSFGYAKRDGFAIVTIDYIGSDMQFVILLPNDPTGLATLEATLSGKLLADCARLASESVDLHLPKFKMQPPTVSLKDELKALGMKQAFDEPQGSADFDRMVPRDSPDALFISEVLHKTFIELDEQGTEAAAATAVIMMARSAAGPGQPPIEVRVDRPFIYAIQHKPTAVCLFLGRVVDPR